MKCAYIDMHCDTLTRSFFKGDGTFFDGPFMQSISHMREAGQMAQFFAVYFPPAEELIGMSDEDFFKKIRANFLSDISRHQDMVSKAESASDIETAYAAGRSCAVLTIEDGRIVNYSFRRLRKLKEEGVAAIALTWNYPNCFGYPHSTDPELMGKGLTDFGKEAVKLMNEIGIIIDVSHLSDGGFWDVARLSGKPFIASHSGARAVCPHTRNLSDEMIRALGERGGVAGLNFYSGFTDPLMREGITKVSDLAAHILHMIDVGGEDTAALGTDFDGIDGASEISHPEEMYLLFDELKRRGLSGRQLDKVAFSNVMRVMRDTL